MAEKDKGKRRRFYTPNEVRQHSTKDNCWVSLFGKVFDLTQLVFVEANKECPNERTRTILKNAGKDVSHWFDPTTGDIRTYVSPETCLEAPFTPQGSVPHVPPHSPVTDWPNDFESVWWKDDNLCVGKLSAHTRKIGVLNVLTQQTAVIEVCEEETLAEVSERYSEIANSHASSYVWKFLGKQLDLTKTLSENGVPDDERRFSEVGVDGTSFIPTLFVYFSDDLTVQ